MRIFDAANEYEANSIALPFGYLLGTTLLFVLQRAGLADLQARLGLSERIGKWCCRATLRLVGTVQVWPGGVGDSFALLADGWQGIEMLFNSLEWRGSVV